jgi:hypothetical protein
MNAATGPRIGQVEVAKRFTITRVGGKSKMFLRELLAALRSVENES